MDDGFLGFFSIDDTLQLLMLCTDANHEPQTPDGAPTFTIYESDGSATTTGSLGASDHNSKTGLRRGTQTLSTANGFASSSVYTVLVEYAISATSFSKTATFIID